MWKRGKIYHILGEIRLFCFLYITYYSGHSTLLFQTHFNVQSHTFGNTFSDLSMSFHVQYHTFSFFKLQFTPIRGCFRHLTIVKTFTLIE